jgi:Tol biopolymer transport system component
MLCNNYINNDYGEGCIMGLHRFMNGYFLPVVILFVLHNSTVTFAQESIKGDITHDGIVDGRDALRILQSLEGVLTLSSDEIQQGDVYPSPGTDGRRIGDGVLTEDDAETILQHAVGLIPLGDITGNYTNSTPKIVSVEPASAPVGAGVSIIGLNFPSSDSGDIAVFFGDVPAEILSSDGLQIITRVPEGAETSLIRLETPGGVITSAEEFYVLTNNSGVLKVDGNLDPKDFLIVTPYDASEIDNAEGFFEVYYPLDKLVLIAAGTESDENNTYYTFYHPNNVSAPLQIDAKSTAVALVFMHPFIFTKEELASRYIFSILESLDEVDALAEMISERYPENADGLNDPELETAWMSAVNAALNALSQENFSSTKKTNTSSNNNILLSSMSPLKSPQETQERIHLQTDDESPKIRVYGVDSNFLQAVYDDQTKRLNVSLQNYSPVDWVTTLRKVNPEDMPKGINEPFYDLRERSIEELGYYYKSLIASEQWTANIDILYTGVDKFTRYVLPGDSSIPLENMEDSIYILHGFSGAIWNNSSNESRDEKAVNAIHDGKEQSYYAMGINIMLASVDFWDLVTPNSLRWTRGAVKKGVQNVVRKISQRLANIEPSAMTTKEIVSIFFDAMLEGMKGAATATPQAFVSWVQSGVPNEIPNSSDKDKITDKVKKWGQKVKLKTFNKFGKILYSANKILNVADKPLFILDKASSLGRVLERMLGLMGKIVNVKDFELANGPSSLETYIIVVGDPFTPTITAFEPKEATPGDLITLKGERFAANPSDNKIIIGGTEVQAESVTTDRKTLTFRVSENLTYDNFYPIQIETPASMTNTSSKQELYIKRIPSLNSLDRVRGFASVPVISNSLFTGTKIELTLQGNNMQPISINDSVYFNETLADVIEYSQKYVRVNVPELLPGTVDVYIYSIEGRGETDKIPYEIIGPPEIDTLNPYQARAGRYITIQGKNFGDSLEYVKVLIDGVSAPEIKSVTENEIVFRMPNLGDIYQSLPVQVITPSGKSAPKDIIRDEGFEDINLTAKPGWQITVTTQNAGINPDGEMTFDEALMFGRGEENPLDEKWDDKNEKWTHHYHEYKRYDDNSNPYYIWEETNIDKEVLNSTFDNEVITHYRVNHDHADHGGTVHAAELVRTESLDFGDNQKIEEGDLITPFNLDDQNGGLNREDQINFDDDLDLNIPFVIEKITVGEYDDITMSNNATVTITGEGINLKNGSQLMLGKVSNQNGYVVTINGVGNSVEGRFENVANGVYIEEGIGNSIWGTISSSNGYGVYIKSGGKNYIDCGISICAKSGIVIEDSDQNLIGTRNYTQQKLAIENCSENGITLKNANQTEIQSVRLSDNQGDGIYLTDESQFNEISMVYISGAQNGLHLDGLDVEKNTFNDVYIGYFSLPDEQNKIYNAPIRQNGIYVTNGASKNSFTMTNIFQCNENGIVLDGNLILHNKFKDINIGLIPDPNNSLNVNQYATVTPIGLDGIAIRNGASFNAFNSINVMNCSGNGVSIQGQDIVANNFENCTFGLYDEQYETQKDLFKIDGYGIRISDGPLRNNFTFCDGGYCVSGGASLNSPGISNDPLLYSMTLSQCNFGFKLKNGKLGDPIAELQTGNGIELISCVNVFVDRCHTVAYHNGLLIEGDQAAMDSGFNKVWAGTYRKTQSNGIHIVGSHELDIQNVMFNDCANSYIYVSSAINLLLKGCMTRVGGDPAIGQYGIYLRNCDDIEINNCSIHNVNDDSIFVEWSTGVQIIDPTIFNAGDNGVYLAETSSDIQFKGGQITSNLNYGIFIDGAKNITINNIICAANKQHGVMVMNGESIDISKSYLDSNVLHGIVVDGANSKDVTIQATYLYANGEDGARILDGKQIMIGGFGNRSEFGNIIQLNNGSGVFAKGNVSGFAIMNNWIGEFSATKMDKNNPLGNLNGVTLSKINDVVVSNNLIIGNGNHGVLVEDDAERNYIGNNKIYKNGSSGVQVDGLLTSYNRIMMNSFTLNGGKAIELNDGNNNQEAPIIEKVTWKGENISGSVNAPNNSTVEIYADYDDEGALFVGTGRVFYKKFHASGKYDPIYNLRATVTTPDGDTSELGTVDIQSEQRDSFVFTQSIDDNSDIYYKPQGNSTPQRMTTNSAVDESPRLTADGETIVFVSDRDGNTDLWSLHTTSLQESKITNSEASEYDPFITKDSTILYVSEADGDAEIYRMPISSGGSSGEIVYGTSPGEFGTTTSVNSPILMLYNASPGTISQLEFYIQDKVAPFKWKITTWNEDAPGDILAEGEATPTDIGWYEIDTGGVSNPSVFAVIVYPENDYEPAFGANNPAPGETVHGKWYAPWEDRWLDHEWNLLFKVIIETAPPIQLTNNSVADRYPAASPDGSQIVYSSNQGDTFDIWVMQADGTDARQLTDGEGNNTKPTWSSDGSRIAFVSDRDGQLDIYQIGIDGNGLTRLTQHDGIDDDPCWSLDGERLLFSSNRNGEQEIYVMTPGTQTASRLTYTSGVSSQPHTGPILTQWIANTNSENYIYQSNSTSANTAELSIDGSNTSPGSTVTVPLKISQALNAGNIDLSVTYDAAILQLTDIGIHDAFLNDSLYAVNPESALTESGFFKMNWINAVGFNGDSFIVHLSFEVDDTVEDEYTMIRFSSANAYDIELNEINITSSDGEITIEQDETSVHDWMIF